MYTETCTHNSHRYDIYIEKSMDPLYTLFSISSGVFFLQSGRVLSYFHALRHELYNMHKDIDMQLRVHHL